MLGVVVDVLDVNGGQGLAADEQRLASVKNIEAILKLETLPFGPLFNFLYEHRHSAAEDILNFLLSPGNLRWGDWPFQTPGQDGAPKVPICRSLIPMKSSTTCIYATVGA